MRIRSRTRSSSLGGCAEGVFAGGIWPPFFEPTFDRTTSYRATERVIHRFGFVIYTCAGVYFTLGVTKHQHCIVTAPIEIRTPRLIMRQWRESDREPFAAMNADPEVMRFFPSTQSSEASGRSIDVWRSELEERGWSNWAVEIAESGVFVGFIGLTIPRRALPFMPCVEVGYRLDKAQWGKGLATEGAAAALRVGFEQLGLQEIVSFTALLNLPSQAVMRRIGMVNTNEDFDHPAVPEGSPLRRHCLYRLSRERWAAAVDA